MRPALQIRDDGTSTAIMRGTRIGRGAARLLTLALLVVMITPITQQILAHAEPGLLPLVKADAHRFGVQVMLQGIERHLVYDSQFANTVRQPYQRLLLSALGQGSRTVAVGHGHRLFHRSDIASVAGSGVLSERFLEEAPRGTDIVENLVRALQKNVKSNDIDDRSARLQPAVDSYEVFLDLSRQLRDRGVHLVLVIVPSSVNIYPERLWPGYPAGAGPAWNIDHAAWKQQLTDAGIDVLDLSHRFWSAKHEAPEPLFLEWDTHWTPRGVDVAADAVADHLRPLVAGPFLQGVTTETLTVPEPTDLLALLGLQHDPHLFPRREIELTRVRPADSALAATGDLAPILLLGDSLTAYYDENGEDAGLAWQLMRRLNMGVQRFVGFGDQEIPAIQGVLSSPGTLAHKRVVVLEFHLGAIYGKRFRTRFHVR